MNAKGMILLCLLGAMAPAAHSSVLTYDLTITIDTGPLSGDTGSGEIVYDSSLAQTDGTNKWVDPLDGLSTFTITFLGQTLTESEVVGFNAGPVVFLNSDLTLLNPFGAWGSTSTLAPGYFINALNGGEDGFEFHTLSEWVPSGSGSDFGYSPVFGGNDVVSTGVVTWSLASSAVPEPSSIYFSMLGVALIGWRLRSGN